LVQTSEAFRPKGKPRHTTARDKRRIVALSNFLQCPLAQKIGIAFAGLGKFNDALGHEFVELSISEPIVARLAVGLLGIAVVLAGRVMPSVIGHYIRKIRRVLLSRK
jgi:hypothetical protein